MNLVIKNQEVELKSKMRALVIFEQISNKPFNPVSVTDMLLYMYSVILACKPDIDLQFDEFMDIMDEEPELYNKFTEWMVTESNKNNLLNDTKKKKAKK